MNARTGVGVLVSLVIVTLVLTGGLGAVLDLITDKFGGSEFVNPLNDAETGDYSRSDIKWTISPYVESNVLEFAGNIQEQHRDVWTLCTNNEWASFVIYDYPSSYRTEDPVGAILEPLSNDEYYEGQTADEVIASIWDVDCTSFHIQTKIGSVWPTTFSVGIWAQHRDNSAWGLLDDKRADMR